jgi:hypothetical protein
MGEFEQGNAAGGHAGEVEAIPTCMEAMTARRFPPPWRADKMPGGYVVRDANGQALAFIYSRDSEAEAMQVLTKDEARPSISRGCRRCLGKPTNRTYTWTRGNRF